MTCIIQLQEALGKGSVWFNNKQQLLSFIKVMAQDLCRLWDQPTLNLTSPTASPASLHHGLLCTLQLFLSDSPTHQACVFLTPCHLKDQFLPVALLFFETFTFALPSVALWAGTLPCMGTGPAGRMFPSSNLSENPSKWCCKLH